MPPDTESKDLPSFISRYRVIDRIGMGSFGAVLRARDDDLDRDVAIKVPHRHLIASEKAVDAFLAEARILASLDHPGIVPIYDVGCTEDGIYFLVAKLIEGTDLNVRLQRSRPSQSETVEIVARVAEALDCAHLRGLVHRDVKLANILLDPSGRPILVDFGLALREENVGSGPMCIGTPAYMSPEQARGEGHRVDRRSDIYSLGVAFYELLVGQRPFKADSLEQLLQQIISVEPRSPRQLDERIPRELERICLKALSKRATDRYPTAREMADDLRCFLSSVPGETLSKDLASKPPVAPDGAAETGVSVKTAANSPGSSSFALKIVPKGLRSYGPRDADFFLELLPGPRDRDGLPDSIRFWKTFIEATDAEHTFPVGLLYGPTGCGKSSLVKAGLLPRLSDRVLAVYLEATAADTETRLLNGLRRRIPSLSTDLAPRDALAALRRGPSAGKKVVIIIDQFEQWLHAKREDLNAELTQALRQCDGTNLQCVLMVRDDFWMAATRFMRELEIRLLEGQNSAAVDLFPIRHAEKVLSAFGRAYGVLRDAPNELEKHQKQFIEQAVAGLAQEGKVNSVRLALFAEMFKTKAWTPAALKEVGGAAGVGLTFLEETFSAATAPPQNRYHQKAAQGVLKALLPESGADLKGQMKSHRELLAAADYGSRPNDFDDLIRILDAEIRLITPTDPQDSGTGISSAKRGEKYYQLTHDYLVPALRRWLTYKQRETRRGRAELRLGERTAMWSARPESRYLPAWWEWLSIHFFTPRHAWNEAQRLMMASANRYHMVRTLAGVCVLAVLAMLGIFQEQRLADLRAQARVKQLISVIRTFRLEDVEQYQTELKRYEKWSRPLLQEMIADPATAPRDRLNAQLVLLPMDETQIEPLLEEMLSLDQRPSAAVRRVLLPYKERIMRHLEGVLAEPARTKGRDQRRARAAGALFRLGRPEVCWPLLRHSSDPGLRGFLMHDLASGGVDPQVLIQRFDSEPDVSVRRAILLVLGDFSSDQVVARQRQEFIDRLFVLYRDDPDPGLHAAVEWLLRRWGQAPSIRHIEQTWARDKAQRDRRLEHLRKELARDKPSPQWYVNGQGQTMVVIPGPVQFVMGSPTTEVGRNESSLHKFEELQHEVRIGRSFALAANLVTLAQYRCFNKEGRLAEKYTRAADLPVVGIDWYMAAAYCNWLSQEEGIAREQWCYEADPQGKVTKLKPGYLALAGYRLPTEAETEYSTRAGAITSRYYGESAELLAEYAWYQDNSKNQTWPVASLKPNDLGFFDMLGNAFSWCQESYTDYPSTKPGQAIEDREGDLVVNNTADRVLRGQAFNSHLSSLRCADRFNMVPTAQFEHISFRVAKTVVP
jgi:serine/threonine protein kinase/formylglycine-generating enzyme required for sulfatase activity